jgi:hypothetical protein
MKPRDGAGRLDVAVQLVQWAGVVDPHDPVVHLVRAHVYAQKAGTEPSLMAQNVYRVCRGAHRPQQTRWRLTSYVCAHAAGPQSAQMESEAVLKTAAWRYRERESRVIGCVDWRARGVVVLPHSFVRRQAGASVQCCVRAGGGGSGGAAGAGTAAGRRAPPVAAAGAAALGGPAGPRAAAGSGAASPTATA